MNAPRARLLGAIIVLVGAATIATYLAARPLWTGDSYHYGIRMVTYAGESREAATARAQTFFEQLPEARRYKHYAELFSRPVPDAYWRLFTPRVLYPALASVLWPRCGFFALIYVSAGAYVVAAVFMYLLLLEFANAAISLIGALLFAVSVPVTSLARAALTDMLALSFWIVVLVCLTKYLRTRTTGWLVAYAVASLALTFTRPVPYLPFFAALVPMAAGLARRERTYVIASLACVSVSIAIGVLLLIVGWISRVPDFEYVLKDMQHYAMPLGPAMPTGRWYAQAIALALRRWAVDWVTGIAPVIGIGGLIVFREHAAVPVLWGALLAGFVTVLLDPLLTDFWRTIAAPMLPVILCGAALAVTKPQAVQSMERTV